jgi:hypothetical protein
MGINLESSPLPYLTGTSTSSRPANRPPIRAAERADELLESGDIDGAGIWWAIMGAIEELQRGPDRRNGQLRISRLSFGAPQSRRPGAHLVTAKDID